MDRILENLSVYWHAWLVGSLLFVLTVAFVADFVLKASRLKKKLANALTALSAIKTRVSGNLAELSEITDGPMATPELAHAWREYMDTLHPQYEVDGTGQMRIVRWRATALAETFFSNHTIVDIPLRADFYKHLPGILTGLGIIGTFLGLINGLISFDASDPAQAQTELAKLINAVGHAFVVSATAIGIAMFFTWIEKSLVTARHRQLSQLVEMIDSLFDAGAGEEYLARLVTASETQATQAAHIKDALVADLRELLTRLTQQQIQAQAEHSDRMSANLGQAIAKQLGGPIEQIAAAVEKVSANQGDALNRMLTDVLAGFSERLEEMFGGQLQGMSDLLNQTSQAMRESADKFAQLAANMDAAGKGTVDAMGERMNAAITSLEERQHVMNKQMSEFINQIRGLVAESHIESSNKLREMLGHLEQGTSNAVQSLSTQTSNLMAQSAETNRSLQDAIEKLSTVTTEAITRMNQGAERLYEAASEFAQAGQKFAQAGQSVDNIMHTAGKATDNIMVTSSALNAATSAAKEALADYSRTRDAFAEVVTELKSITENARREAGMTKEFIDRIEAAAKQLDMAQRQSEEYLNGVNKVLDETYSSFATHVKNALREANRQFQDELRQAVDMVSAAIVDLADTLEDVPRRRR